MFAVIDDDASTSFVWVFVIALIALVVVLALISIFRKSLTTKTLAYAGLTIAASFALSFIKVSPVTYGGSITLASMLPISIFAYAFGFIPALLVGLIYGILQFIQSPYIFTYSTLLLDFLLAFPSICLMAVSRKVFKDNKWTPIIGITLVFAFRFLCHFGSGLIYFENGGIWANLPKDNAFIYSFLYQITYLLPDLIICIIVLLPLCLTGRFKTFIKLIEK